MSFVKRLAGDAVWVLLARLVVSGSSIIIVAMLARLMSPEELGYYMLLVSMVLGFTMFSLFGMEQVSVRELAKYKAKYDGNFPAQLIKNFYIVSVTALLLSSLVIFQGKSFLDSYFFKGPLLDEFFIPVCLWAALLTFSKLSTECFRGMHKIAIASMVGETLGVTILISLIGLMLIYDFTLELSVLVWLMVAAYGVSTVIGMILLSRNCSYEQDDKNDFNLLNAFSVGRPLTMIAVISFFISQADLWVLALFFEAKDVAVYGVVLRVISLISIPLMIINLVIKPYIPGFYERGKKKKLESLLRTISTLVLIPSSIFLLSLFIYGAEVLNWLFGQAYTIGSSALSVLIFAKLVQIGVGSCGTLLIMTGHQKDLLYISLVNGCLLFVCLYLFVEPFAIIGCAAATAFAVISQNIIMLIVAKKRTDIWTCATFDIKVNFIKGLLNKLDEKSNS